MKRLGKINRNKLNDLFQGNLGKKSDKILQGPAFGVDTGIIRLNDHKSLIIASDPASFIPSLGIKESAWLTVILSANDIATSGFLPEYAQFILNLSHEITDDQLTEFWNDIHQFCLDIGVSITGGHTGFDNIGSSTLAGGTTMFTIVDNQKIKSSSFAKPGQDLILTKSAAISSGAILAKSFPNHTKENLGEETYNILSESFYQTSILSEVKALNQHDDVFKKVSAMHDVTEGGCLGAIYELCEASKVGVKIDKNKINIDPAQKKICELFQIDPLRSTGAGSLLIACDKEVSTSILTILRKSEIAATIVGETLPQHIGKNILDKGVEKKLVYLEKDPYWEAFFNAIEKRLK